MPDIEKLVKITLDKERRLRLTLRGMLEFEKLTGRNLFKGFKIQDLDLKENAALIWACLIDEDKELKYDDVLDMVDISNFTLALQGVMDCIRQAFPEPKVSERPLAKKPQPG